MKTVLSRGICMICTAGLLLFWPGEPAAQEDAADDSENETESLGDAEDTEDEAEILEDDEDEAEALEDDEDEAEALEAAESEKDATEGEQTDDAEVLGADEEKAWSTKAVATEDAPAVETPTDEPNILKGTWTKNIVFSTDDGSFKFQPRGWVQPRFLLTFTPDAEDIAEGTGFSLKRARFGFQAWLFDWARFYLDTGFSSGTGRLIDYFVDLDPFGGVAVLRIGHFRPYFCRQLLMATTKLAMIEYAQAWQDGALGLNLGRDIGLGVHGFVFGGLEYGVGIWNGENVFNPAGNLDFEMGGRVAVHPLALAGVGNAVLIGDESDASASRRPGLVVGAAAFYERRHDLFIEVGDATQQYYDNQFKLGVDVAFKYLGLSVQGELFLVNTWIYGDTPDAVTNFVETTDDTMANNLLGMGIGMYLQAGYFILPGQLEIIGRFDMVDEDSELRGNRYYPAVGGTYYFFGHNLKAQLMYRLGMGAGYEEPDPGYVPTTHDVFLMFQASI